MLTGRNGQNMVIDLEVPEGQEGIHIVTATKSSIGGNNDLQYNWSFCRGTMQGGNLNQMVPGISHNPEASGQPILDGASTVFQKGESEKKGSIHSGIKQQNSSKSINQHNSLVKYQDQQTLRFKKDKYKTDLNVA